MKNLRSHNEVEGDGNLIQLLQTPDSKSSVSHHASTCPTTGQGQGWGDAEDRSGSSMPPSLSLCSICINGISR